ncbi:MAG: M64 family metallo-endopeptidase [Bacteroidetes bacterium]|nr:M64 family metallo-endopeptidase [Bacteroidota bacterium]
MKKIYTLLSLILCSVALSAQVFDVDTIYWSGPSSNRVNIVILGDGYTSGEQAKFITDATAISNAFFTTSPYLEYKNYINVLAIKVISNQSGAGHAKNSSDNACGSQPAATVDNYFGSAFDCGGGSYHRLLCAGKSYKVPGVMAANWPDYDQVLLVANSTYYGGAGGTYAVTSVNGSATEIAIHEVGHSFAYLADEYWAGSQYATNAKPNMTNVADVNSVKWKPWVGHVGLMNVGLYSHSGDASWKKPVNGQCKMEYLGTNYPFCPVCAEAHTMKFLDLTKPYDAYTPSNAATIDGSNDIIFGISTLLPIPNTLEIQWTVNGNVVSTGISKTYTALVSALIDGDNTVQARLLDKTTLIRSASHVTAHSFLINWTVNKSATTGISTTATTDDFKYTLYPNPTSNETNLLYHLNAAGAVSITLYDLYGKAIPVLNEQQKMGDHQLNVNASRLGLSSGVYLVSFVKDGIELSTERIIVE